MGNKRDDFRKKRGEDCAIIFPLLSHGTVYSYKQHTYTWYIEQIPSHVYTRAHTRRYLPRTKSGVLLVCDRKIEIGRYRWKRIAVRCSFSVFFFFLFFQKLRVHWETRERYALDNGEASSILRTTRWRTRSADKMAVQRPRAVADRPRVTGRALTFCS